MKTVVLTMVAVVFAVSNLFSQNKGDFPPPQNLQYSNYEPDWIEFNWQQPSMENWLNWGNGNVLTYFSFGENLTFSIASRWDAESLTNYTGRYLKKIRFFPVESSVTYILKVWKGENASNELLSQNTSELTYESWNEVALSDSILIEEGDELWFGLECVVPAGELYPVTADDGANTIDGYGNMMKIDGQWGTLLETGMQGNWNIAGILNTGQKLSKSKSLLGYNLYRDNVMIKGGFPETYEYDTPEASGIYEYYVTAVYEEGESAPSNTVQVNWSVTDIAEQNIPKLTLFPNPAASFLNLKYDLKPDKLTIFNSMGKIVLQKEDFPNNKSLLLDVSTLNDGIYFLNITFGKHNLVKKIVIRNTMLK
jgi:hypothetical protein